MKRIKKNTLSAVFTTITLGASLFVSQKIQAWGLPEHKHLTIEASKIVKLGGMQINPENEKALIFGSTFNDLYTNNEAGFVAKYLAKSDPFINQSHKESMQWLHCMSDSSKGESAEETTEKILNWLEFCQKVSYDQINGDEKFFDFIMSDEGQKYKEMFCRLFATPKFLKNNSNISTDNLLDHLERNQKDCSR